MGNKMKVRAFFNCVRVSTPCGGELEFKKLGDLNVAANPKILRPTLGKWYTKARKAALDELANDFWGAR